MMPVVTAGRSCDSQRDSRLVSPQQCYSLDSTVGIAHSELDSFWHGLLPGTVILPFVVKEVTETFLTHSRASRPLQ